MKVLAVSLAGALLLAAGAASAQSYDDRYGPAPYGNYEHRNVQDRGIDRSGEDWARVVRVDPVFNGRARAIDDPRCRTRRDSYASVGDPRSDRYADPYGDRYGNGYGGREDDRYSDPYAREREWRRDENGRMVATVVGGIAGAVLGSRIGDGSGQFIGTAVGSMVGGMAGRGVYEANRRAREPRDAYVTVCDPDGWRGASQGSYEEPYARGIDEYDVTYEYGGRQYTTRTRHHPGDRIRVRVDVRAAE